MSESGCDCVRSYIIHVSVQDHPTAILGVVFCDFRRVDCLRHFFSPLPFANSFNGGEISILKLQDLRTGISTLSARRGLLR